MTRPFDAPPEFDRAILPGLRAIPFFRLAPEGEVTASFAAYRAGDPAGLVETWRRVAAPTRADVGGLAGGLYRRARLLPRPVVRMTFLATVRAVLAAGRTFFAEQLRPETARAIRARFSFLERRHEHVPDGWTPPLRFPDEFAAFVDGASLDEALARFQLAAALNEVQQHAYSLHLADLLGLPEVRRHAAREREMALAYLGHWSPPATEALWRQVIYVLDGLNAAVFAMACRDHALSFPVAAAWHALRARGEWARFVRGMDRPL